MFLALIDLSNQKTFRNGQIWRKKTNLLQGVSSLIPAGRSLTFACDEGQYLREDWRRRPMVVINCGESGRFEDAPDVWPQCVERKSSRQFLTPGVQYWFTAFFAILASTTTTTTTTCPPEGCPRKFKWNTLYYKVRLANKSMSNDIY